MNFKLWLEQFDDVLNCFNNFDPDTIYCVPGFDSFIHNLDDNMLYVENSNVSHGSIVNEKKIHVENCVFGRFGEITEHNREELNNFKLSENVDLPIDIIVYWKSWTARYNNVANITLENIEKSIKCFSNNLFKKITGHLSQRLPIDGETIIVDGFREPHYLHQTAKHNENKQYSIGSFHFTSEDVRDWMAQLHSLPLMSPERYKIVQNAIAINNSPLKNEFKDFISRALTKFVGQNRWNQEAERLGIKKPGQKLLALNSESKHHLICPNCESVHCSGEKVVECQECYFKFKNMNFEKF